MKYRVHRNLYSFDRKEKEKQQLTQNNNAWSTKRISFETNKAFVSLLICGAGSEFLNGIV